MVKTLFIRSGFYFSALMVVKVFSIVVFLGFAKILLPAEFGVLSLFTTLMTMVTLVGDWGLVQYYQLKSGKNDRALSTRVSQARMLSAVISMLFSLFYLLLTNSFSFTVSLYFLCMIFPEGLMSIVDGYYLVEKKNVQIAIKQLFKYLAPLVLLVVVPNPSIHMVIGAFFVSSILTSIWYIPTHFYPRLPFSFRESGNLLKESSQYAALIFTSSIYSKGDSILISLLLGKVALGFYSVGYRYLDSLSIFPSAVSQSLFHISAKDKNITARQLVGITMIMFMLGCIVALLLFSFSGFLTIGLLGIQYVQSLRVVEIFSFVIVLIFLNAPLSTYVQSSTLLKSFLPWAMLNTVANIVFNILLLPVWGIEAAAWVMVCTECTGLIINLYFSKRRLLST